MKRNSSSSRSATRCRVFPSQGTIGSGLWCRLVLVGGEQPNKSKFCPGECQQVKCCDSPHVSHPPPPPRLGGGGREERGYVGEACKPLLSLCSRVICQLSCSARQSLGEIAAYSAASLFSPLSWTWAPDPRQPAAKPHPGYRLVLLSLSFFFHVLLFVSVRGKMSQSALLDTQMLHVAQCDEIRENKRKTLYCTRFLEFY